MIMYHSNGDEYSETYPIPLLLNVLVCLIELTHVYLCKILISKLIFTYLNIPLHIPIFQSCFDNRGSIFYSAITLSVPDTASVIEESGSVQVCATLSDVPAGGTVAINIVLATSNGMNRAWA